MGLFKNKAKKTEKSVPDSASKKAHGEETVFTKETLGVVLILFATLVLVCLITGDKIFSAPGKVVSGFLFGLFGYFAYCVVVAFALLGIRLLTDKKIAFPTGVKFFLTLTMICTALLLHVISVRDYASLPYSEYLSQCYSMGEGSIGGASAGGLATGILAYAFTLLLTNVGSYVVLGILTSVCIYATVKSCFASENVQKKSTKFRTSFVKKEEEDYNTGVSVEGEKEYPVQNAVPPKTTGVQKLFVADAKSDDFRSKRKNVKESETFGIKVDFTQGGLGVANSAPTYANSYTQDMQSKLEYIKTPAAINLDKPNTYYNDGKTRVSEYISVKPSQPSGNISLSEAENKAEQKSNASVNIPLFEHSEKSVFDSASVRADKFSGYANAPETDIKEVKTEPEQIQRGLRSSDLSARANDTRLTENTFNESVLDNIDNRNEQNTQENVFNDSKESSPQPSILNKRRVRELFGEENKEETEQTEKDAYISRVASDGNAPSQRISSVRGRFAEQVDSSNTDFKKDVSEKVAPPINRVYYRPPFELLQSYSQPIDAPTENHAENLEIIKQTLSDFHINAEPQGYIQGPSITRYEITMPAGISVKKVLSYDDDLRMRLSSREGVRIQAPIPGKNLVGVEVANKIKITVGLREVMEKAAQKGNDKPGSLMFALGKDIVGNAITDNLAKGPHYLVAGATGSGKSVCLNTMIISLIMRYSPEELRLFLVDPKGVEFATYEHLPHLMIDEIITKPQKAIAMLKWAYEEMERRFSVFRESEAFVVDIDGYNSQVASDTVPKMPRIVIIIDELADLMQTCKKDLEARICAIAQKARSAGIHLVLATQRPSVDVITGTIKANLPSRIAFKVMNFADSQTILGESGAEKLLGNGDMLYKNSSMPGYERYQGAFITTREINSVVSYVKEKNKAYFDQELQERLEREVSPKTEEQTTAGGNVDNAENNTAFLQALWFAVNSGEISISALQRRFSFGFPKAGGILDKMERMGYVGPNEGKKTKKVLLSREDFIERYGDGFSEEGM